MFATAPPAEVAAILSCLVFEAKKVEEPKLDDEPDLKRVCLILYYYFMYNYV